MEGISEELGASPDGDRAAPASQPSPAVSGIAGIPSAGDVATIAYPFVRGTYSGFDGEGYGDLATWTPGVRYEAIGPEDSGAVADALGVAIFRVEGVFKPGRFPTRVFFTRKFIDPEGKAFGKGRLHIVTLEKFRRLTRGYQHPFGIGAPVGRAGHWDSRRAAAEFEKMLAEYGASADTRPEGGDALAAPFTSGAVPQADAQTP